MADTTKKDEVVKYTGHPGPRKITKEQWEAVGVKSQDTVVWSKFNRYSVPVSDLTKAAIAVLAEDGAFKIV